MTTRMAKFDIGQVVKHRIYPFRGVIFDVDPTFANTEEWWRSIPAEIRPSKDQPFYHLYAENADSQYIAYVSEQNLLPDESGRRCAIRRSARRSKERPTADIAFAENRSRAETRRSPEARTSKARPAPRTRLFLSAPIAALLFRLRGGSGGRSSCGGGSGRSGC